MSIQSTLRALYAIRCAAEETCRDDTRPIGKLESLLRTVSDEEVTQSIDQLGWLLEELAHVQSNLKAMYILHYKSGTDKGNKNVLLQTECVFGNTTNTFTTMFDQKATQSLIDALTWSLNMVKAGDKLSDEGRA